jgi:hypothetical protein
VAISTMFREGLLLNLVGAFVVSLGLWWLLPQ